MFHGLSVDCYQGIDFCRNGIILVVRSSIYKEIS